MGTGAGEAVQQSSDAVKDDGLPRLEGEGGGAVNHHSTKGLEE